MFNLGQKSIVINSDSSVVAKSPAGVVRATEAAIVAGDIIEIAGFGTFTVPTDAAAFQREGSITPASNAVAGVYTILAAAAAEATKSYILTLNVRSSRLLSNVFTDGDIMKFQSKSGGTVYGAGFSGAQIAGFNDNIVKLSGTGNNIIVTFQPGYEGMSVESATLTDSAGTSVVLTSITTTTAPSEGVNLGRHIEETVHNATEGNLDPYGLGTSDAVDVRGKYTEIAFTSVAEDDDSPGWAPHEMLGYGDANTGATYAPRRFSVYVNEASAATALAYLRNLVLGPDDVVSV
jgi:hypothetical protein